MSRKSEYQKQWETVRDFVRDEYGKDWKSSVGYDALTAGIKAYKVAQEKPGAEAGHAQELAFATFLGALSRLTTPEAVRKTETALLKLQSRGTFEPAVFARYYASAAPGATTGVTNVGAETRERKHNKAEPVRARAGSGRGSRSGAEERRGGEGKEEERKLGDGGGGGSRRGRDLERVSGTESTLETGGETLPTAPASRRRRAPSDEETEVVSTDEEDAAAFWRQVDAAQAAATEAGGAGAPEAPPMSPEAPPLEVGTNSDGGALLETADSDILAVEHSADLSDDEGEDDDREEEETTTTGERSASAKKRLLTSWALISDDNAEFRGDPRWSEALREVTRRYRARETAEEQVLLQELKTFVASEHCSVGYPPSKRELQTHYGGDRESVFGTRDRQCFYLPALLEHFERQATLWSRSEGRIVVEYPTNPATRTLVHPHTLQNMWRQAQKARAFQLKLYPAVSVLVQHADVLRDVYTFVAAERELRRRYDSVLDALMGDVQKFWDASLRRDLQVERALDTLYATHITHEAVSGAAPSSPDHLRPPYYGGAGESKLARAGPAPARQFLLRQRCSALRTGGVYQTFLAEWLFSRKVIFTAGGTLLTPAGITVSNAAWTVVRSVGEVLEERKRNAELLSRVQQFELRQDNELDLEIDRADKRRQALTVAREAEVSEVDRLIARERKRVDARIATLEERLFALAQEDESAGTAKEAAAHAEQRALLQKEVQTLRSDERKFAARQRASIAQTAVKRELDEAKVQYTQLNVAKAPALAKTRAEIDQIGKRQAALQNEWYYARRLLPTPNLLVPVLNALLKWAHKPAQRSTAYARLMTLSPYSSTSVLKRETEAFSRVFPSFVTQFYTRALRPAAVFDDVEWGQIVAKAAANVADKGTDYLTVLGLPSIQRVAASTVYFTAALWDEFPVVVRPVARGAEVAPPKRPTPDEIRISLE